MLWRSLRLKLVLVYTLLILFAVELIGAYFVRALTTSLINNQLSAAKSQAELMATLVAPQIMTQGKTITSSITNVLQSVPQFLSATIYILNKDGFVTYTTAGGALIGQKRTDTVSTEALLHRNNVVAIRFDPLTKGHQLAVAVPITEHQTFLGILEYVLPIQSTYDTIRQATTIFYTGSIAVLILTIFLGIIVSRALTRPVLDVTRQAQIMAAGDFSKRLETTSNDEFGDLVAGINDLADKLDQALAANQLEQERLQAIITSLGEGVIVLDSTHEVLFMNVAASRMLTSGDGEDGDAVKMLALDDLIESAKSGEPSALRVVQNTVYQVTMTSIQRSNQTDGFVAVVRDVTEQERLNQARRDFVSNVSHELRTPLTSVKSYIEVLRELGEEEIETRQSFLHVIDEETDRMVRLTRDLLQLSGLDRGQSFNVRQAIRLESVMEQVEQRFQLQASQAGLELTVHPLPTEGVFIRGNRDMVHRILDNLVSNAIRYTTTGGLVDVSCAATDTHVVITVADSGIGIPPEDLPHVFERFYRVEKGRSRRMGGTGLGLALASEMAKQIGARIDISSEVDRGTTVVVTFLRSQEVVEV